MSARSVFLDLIRRVEVLTLVVIIVIGGALWAFVALAAEMLEGDLHSFDKAVLLALRVPGDLSDPIGGPQVEVAMRDLTALGGVTVLTLITLCVLVFLVLRRQRASALFMGVAILGGQALSHLAKLGFSRPRPDLVPHGVEVATTSFPSGHSMMAAVTYLTLAVMLARSERHLSIRAFYISVAAILAMLVGVSRVYLGVHWPSDVLAGWTLGAAWALGVWLLARQMGRKGQIEPDRRGES
ncbi:phosphatase PAP2 family protein [Pseudooceanicola spongiae]|jgi:undecaprenyl-diphosphatase|uniref:Phosphatase PAP2 family protein n=1 Tax=Pseudooceanicola spongiae TaxID=2613965 RepID=A0A7L9WJX4_9RHOB|nr:phosphatase PAP2 family protein [Pseudooceanicola spongiae]QOL80134.1 phosphatase PAP2 family protein [Pseudooceanicola spongiae]